MSNLFDASSRIAEVISPDKEYWAETIDHASMLND